jgi:SagB-type dehydrogenase family enzyme
VLPDSESLSGGRRSLPLRDQSTSLGHDSESEPIRIALTYHQETKHHLDRYARTPGCLDWATQPDPFRTFAGSARIELPLTANRVTTAYADLFTPDTVPVQPLDMIGIAAFFELALGLSAWKEFRGSRWALRCNPSSGNLHPTEGYAILPPLSSFQAGVYHYVSRDHCLEQRCVLNHDAASKLSEVLSGNAFLVGLSSIHWREAWKYGERAFRYCQHDVGHAVAAIRFAAAALGWSARLLDYVADDDVAAILGIDRATDFADVDPHDREHPDCLILVSSAPAPTMPWMLPTELLRAGHWIGQANQLSAGHVDWEAIEAVANATWKPTTVLSERGKTSPLPPLSVQCPVPAASLIRQRRSCLALDGQTSISAETFFGMLDHLLPRPDVPPWDVLPWEPQVHLAILVHRVTGLVPGLYVLERDQRIHDRLRAALRPTFLWQKVADCPEHLRLYCLMKGDFRRRAQVISCHQEIASDGTFSLGMVADFAPGIRREGAWWYRRLFWEAGVLGQMLYLEAEAAGVRSTGIGCYFDDAFHDLLGQTTDEFQDLYHFTVGQPVEDKRLLTLPPYAHLQRPDGLAHFAV